MKHQMFTQHVTMYPKFEKSHYQSCLEDVGFAAYLHSSLWVGKRETVVDVSRRQSQGEITAI